MEPTAVTTDGATDDIGIAKVDMKLEVVTIPVSDVDRATAFYTRLGWRQDVTPPGSGIVQFTPPASGCSIHFGTNRTSAAPGSAQGLYLIVSDIVAARERLVAADIEVSEVFHLGADGPASGPAPERASYGSLASFSDPDGNRWLLQEVTTRLPGRVDPAATSFGSASDLKAALVRAATAHGAHEKRMGGEYDVNWPDWYAAYMVAEQAGTELPT
jgi:catechol 2,3-dioxygenase-like lactoylglutathione lyase family enzyme